MVDTPVISNDCFALPAGVTWTSVDKAREHLRAAVDVVVASETVETGKSGGRILAENAIAARSNPPYANAAMDGYGFAFDAETPSLRLLDGRSAAGEPFADTVPPGYAIRILTGAKLPDGVDTVVMQEDVLIKNNQVVFAGGLKPGANCREAGEDVHKGQVAVCAGEKIGAPEIALMAALNIPEVKIYKKLRIGVLSTGNEIRQLGARAEPHQIYDANRPMLLEMLDKWGFETVDLGHAMDTRNAVVLALESGVKNCDAILTSGGASAGDEDHLSAVLAENGSLDIWRIAIKPGRPLALGIWAGVPVFGLPGNPVAAFVTALVFARPTLLKMQGAGWKIPAPTMLPADFSLTKKAGRREFLRARVTSNGRVEKFESEGSGRISSLSWADGLVELPDAGVELNKGDLVQYTPFCAFGL